jgi:hypothetical protein
VTHEQAQEQLDAIIQPLQDAPPDGQRSGPVLDDIRSAINLMGRPIMQFLVAAAGLVLLLGGANLANMMLVRARRGERETAVRSALGASRLRLVRSVVFEAVIVGLAGAAVAVAVTAVSFDALLTQVPRGAYGDVPVGVDVRVLVGGLALGLVAACLFAAVPAWRASRLDALALLQGRRRGGASSARAGRPMAVLQVGIAVMLVFGAVVAARAFVAALNVPLGFDPERVLLLSPPRPPDGEDRVGFYRRVLEAVSARDVFFERSLCRARRRAVLFFRIQIGGQSAEFVVSHCGFAL